MSRPMTRGATFHVRVPERTRFGADLLCRRYATNSPQIIERALNDLFIKEGLMSHETGELTTLLDKLYSPDEWDRVVALSKYAPELLTADERLRLQEAQAEAA